MQSHDPALLLLYVLERWRLVAPSRKQRSGVRWWTPYVGVHVRERRCAAGRCVARHVLLAYYSILRAFAFSSARKSYFSFILQKLFLYTKVIGIPIAVQRTIVSTAVQL